mgnify:CR=1 FL=1
MLTPDAIAARTARAVAAATAAAVDLGLTVEQPRVLYDVFSVIVHLVPHDVVVRVPTVLPPAYARAPERQTAQQRAELAVTGWLADRGQPVVPPSPLVPREPVRRDGFSMTFWQFVEQASDADMTVRVEATARLHAALRDYDSTDLGFWVPFNTFIPEGLAQLARLPGLLPAEDVQRAQREWAVLAPALSSAAGFAAAFPGVGVQTIHGDAPYHNMIATPTGALWSDFELVTVGAVESDLAMVGPEAIETYNAAASALGLRRLDERVLRVADAAARLTSVAALSMAPQLPMLIDAVRPVIEMWRATPQFTEL